MRRILLATLGVLALGVSVRALSFPEFSLPRIVYLDFRIPSTIYVDAANLTYTRHFPSETTQGLEGGVHMLRAQSFLPPVKLPRDMLLINGVSFEMDAFHYEPPRPGLVERVYALNAVSGVMYSADERWSYGALFMPTVESDLHGFGRDDFSFLVGAGAQYSFSPAVSVVTGLVYASYIDYPFPLPGVAVFARGRNVKFSAIVPLAADVWYIPHRRVELGLVWDWSSRLYHLNQRYEVDGETYRDGYISYSQGTIALGANVRAWRQLWVTMQAGLSLFSWWEWLDDINAKTYDTTMKDQRFVRLGVVYRFKITDAGAL